MRGRGGSALVGRKTGMLSHVAGLKQMVISLLTRAVTRITAVCGADPRWNDMKRRSL